MQLEEHLKQEHAPYDHELGEDQLTHAKGFKYPEDATLEERHTLYHAIRYWREYLPGGHEHPAEEYKLQRRQKIAARAWLFEELGRSERFDRDRPEEVKSPEISQAIQKRLELLDSL